MTLPLTLPLTLFGGCLRGVWSLFRECLVVILGVTQDLTTPRQFAVVSGIVFVGWGGVALLLNVPSQPQQPPTTLNNPRQPGRPFEHPSQISSIIALALDRACAFFAAFDRLLRCL